MSPRPFPDHRALQPFEAFTSSRAYLILHCCFCIALDTAAKKGGLCETAAALPLSFRISLLVIDLLERSFPYVTIGNYSGKCFHKARFELNGILSGTSGLMEVCPHQDGSPFSGNCRLFGSKAAMQALPAKALLLCVPGFHLVCHYRVKKPFGFAAGLLDCG